MNSKLKAALVIVAVIGLLYGFDRAVNPDSSGSRKPTDGIWWNEYVANAGGEHIVISESQDVGYAPERQVHITKIGDQFTGITGHGDPETGQWYEIFWIESKGINGRRYTGYNSYVRHGDAWVWSPCDADKGMPPIPQAEIPKAIARLDAALKQRTIENAAIIWTYHGSTNLVKGQDVAMR